MDFEPELYLRFLIFISLAFLISVYPFLPGVFFSFLYPFIDEFRIFLDLVSRIYIYNIYHCQVVFAYYLGISIQKRGGKKKNWVALYI